jgi:hypothetical protein
MRQPAPVSHRRIRPALIAAGTFVGLAILWTGLWFYSAGKAQATINGWREREARVGRTYACASEAIGGFPFRIEARCADPVVTLEREVPPIELRAGGLLVVAQIFAPTLVVAELSGPMTLAEPGQAIRYQASWTSAQASARGTPLAPEGASIKVDQPRLAASTQGGAKTAFSAQRVELEGRIVEGSAASNPVIGVTLHLASAAAPELHPLTADPLDADISAVLRGLPDFAPKPWPVRLKELQARGGALEITNARLRQAGSIAVSQGRLALTPGGTLDGQLEVTIAGVERILKSLDLDRLISEGRVGAALNSLDNIIPGLGRLARRNAAPGIAAGLGMIGQNTTLEGRPAVALPLRFADGAVLLGPIPVGRVPPLF